MIDEIEQPAAETDGRRGRPDWDATVAELTGQHPRLGDDRWPDAVARALNNEDLLGMIVRDIIKVDDAPSQRGVRVMPAQELAVARYNDLRNGGATVECFPVAFALLRSGRSIRHVATKTGLAKSKVQRLLAGSERPTVDEMAAIAEAFGKRPWYFAEWRTAAIARAVAEHLAANPEQSVSLAKRMLANGLVA